MVQVNGTAIALLDRIHLRYAADIPGAPAVYERTVEVDSRLPVDDQVAALSAVLLQGLSVYMALTHPEAVTVTLALPEAESTTEPADAGSPWGFGLYAGTWGSWSGTCLNATLPDRRMRFSLGGDYDLSRQPSLELEDSSIAWSPAPTPPTPASCWNNISTRIGPLVRSFAVVTRIHRGSIASPAEPTPGCPGTGSPPTMPAATGSPWPG